MIRRNVLTDNFRNFMVNSSGKQFFVVGDDLGTPDLPYGIIYPLHPFRFGGSMRDDLENASYNYQISSIGEDRRQTEWMSSEVFRVICGRVEGGALDYDFVVPGIYIMERRLEFQGVVSKSGPTLFKADDTYSLRVGVS